VQHWETVHGGEMVTWETPLAFVSDHLSRTVMDFFGCFADYEVVVEEMVVEAASSSVWEIGNVIVTAMADTVCVPVATMTLMGFDEALSAGQEDEVTWKMNDAIQAIEI
jgi:hypothetical protein